MARRPPPAEPYSNRALFERSADPIFVLNRQRRLRYVNPAWEKVAGQSLEDSYNLHCVRDRRASALAQALSPPAEVVAGSAGGARRPAPPSKVGPPWWDISFLPVFGPEGLLGIIGRIVVVGTKIAPKKAALPEGLVQLRRGQLQRYSFASIASEEPEMARVIAQARVAAQNTAPVAIIGEPGAGKSWLARVIHHQGVAAEKSFLPIDCEGLPPSAIELLLFGPAGLGSAERVGTVYLREPAAMPRDLQLRLATWLQTEHAERPRFIAGSRNDLRAERAAERLLAELDLALNVQVIHLPALRERLADLPRLSTTMLERLQQDGAPDAGTINPETLDSLRAYSWPGNLRDLRRTLAEAAERAAGGPIDPAHLPASLLEASRPPAAPRSPERIVPLDATLRFIHRRLVLLALRKGRGHKAEAARLLDLSRTELWRRVEELGIAEDEWRKVQPREGGDAASPGRGI